MGMGSKHQGDAVARRWDSLIRWSEEKERGAVRTNARNIRTRLRARHSLILDPELMVLRNGTRKSGIRMRRG